MSLANDIAAQAQTYAGQASGFSFRNKIINGNFDIWQRGSTVSFTGTGSAVGYISADRWIAELNGGTSGSGTATISLNQQSFALGQTNVPGNPSYFARLQATTLPTRGGTGSQIRVLQRIEFVRTLADKTATLSFYAKADSPRTIGFVASQLFGTGGSPSPQVIAGQQTFNLTTSWQKFTFTFTPLNISGKTTGSNGDSYLVIRFYLYKQDNTEASDTLGEVGTWSTSAYLDIAQVQLEEGTVATKFEDRPISLELMLCQRYYEVTQCNTGGYGVAGTPIASSVPFKVQKRVPPSTSTSGLVYSNSNGFSLAGTNSNFIVTIFNVTSTGNASVSVTIKSDSEI